MAIKVGINGFGRIGRNIMRAAMDDSGIDFVAVNDLTNAETLAHLLKYDSILGNLKADISRQGRPHHRQQGRVPGAVAEGPGAAALEGPRRRRRVRVDRPLHRSRRRRQAHRRGREEGRHHGAGEEARTSPSCSASTTTSTTRRKHHIISNASCTTNCLAPVAKVLHESFGIKKGWMTTVHSYTNDQQLLDLPHKDLRRARAAALSIIPTTTGAALAVGEVLPELKGKLDGIAMRVPTPNVSVRRPGGARRQEDVEGRGQRGVQGGGGRRAEGHPAVRRGAARLDRLPRQSVTRRSSTRRTRR